MKDEENEMGETDNNLFKTEGQLKIWLIAGSYSDISKLDFSKLNLKILKITSEALFDFVDQTKHESFGDHNKKLFEKYRDKDLNREHVYALLPIDITKKIEKHWLVTTTLQVMFPSDISLYAEIDFQFFDNKYLHWIGYSEWPFHARGESYYDNFLIYPESALEDINEFIDLFITRYEKLSYLKTTVSSYTSSFSEVYYRMSYLSLCISLESIIYGMNELVYRIKRNVAILCGEFEIDCWTLFKNIDKIYSLRSQIVHGEEYKYELIEKYLPYLRSLVSRTIIELVSLNQPDKATLNNKLTEIGFGDKGKISKDYKLFYFNSRTMIKITETL